MKTLIYILSAILIVCGICALAMPIFAVASFSELGTVVLILAAVAGIVAVWFIATGVRHFRRKEKDTALAVATASGLLAWLVLNAEALKLTKGIEVSLWHFVGLLIPIMLCYYGTLMLKESIRRKYE
jgi:hypothetical protein